MKNIFVLIALALALQACTSNQSEEGTHAEISMINQKSKPETTDVGEATTKQFVRSSDGKQFQLETGLLNVLPVELVSCSGVSALRPLAGLVSSAYAHGADEVPPGGVLDVSQADGTRIELGEISLAPGTYCGVRVALAPVLGAPVVEGTVDMNGSSFYVNACYYYNSGVGGDTTSHYCFPIKIPGASGNELLEIDPPITVNAGDRHGEATVVVNYDRWFDRSAGDDAFSALDGYATVVSNPPCVAGGDMPADAAACTAAKNDFKAGLQANVGLKELLVSNVLNSLSVGVE